MTFIAAILTLPLVLLTFCFAVEVFAGLKPLRSPRLGARDCKAVIVVPAHDEEAVLPRTLGPLKEAAAGNRILVVADNCTDGTAAIARQFGVEVVERFDDQRRGKGFALDFAREHLKADPPDVVVIIDADCTIDPQSMSILVAACAAAGRPCQATYLQQPGPGASPAVQLSTFAFFIKNVIRQRGIQRVAGRAHLVGTGMALPWPIYASAELATSNIVEDLKLGQDLALAGYPPIFVEQAAVWSNAETDANTISQRRRWEGGFLQNAVRVAPRMFAQSLRSADARMLWSSINTAIPPFALLILLDVVAMCCVAAFTVLSTARVWPLLSLCGTLVLALLALAFAWTRGGSRFVSLGTLGRAPLYVAWKLPMYLGLARSGAPKEWLRTGR